MRISSGFLAVSMTAACLFLPGRGRAQAARQEAPPVFTEMRLPGADLSEFPVDAEGFITLFDGTSAKGWRAYGRETLPQTWIIENGALKFDSKRKREASRGDIVFARKFGNFILDLEWKISRGGNSGIFYLVQEVAGQSIAASGLEAQVLDNENHPDARKGREGNRMSSSIYDLIPAVPQNANPHGEWNRVRIKVENGHVEHWQNGAKVVEYELWTPEWNELLAASKFSSNNWPAAWRLMTRAGGDGREGYIGLQDHGDDVWFRNIRVKITD